MRNLLFAAWMAAAAITPAVAAVDHLDAYPSLATIPGSPVYYAPGVDQNYFFYDGLYWVLDGDTWYDSTWYDGPWDAVDPIDIPSFILQVPVGYYRHPPGYFGGWGRGEAPHWHEHWGSDWDHHRAGWNDHHDGPHFAPAPLPAYQHGYSGEHYPRPDEQAALHGQHYHYQPQEPISRQHYAQHGIGHGGEGGGEHIGGAGGEHGGGGGGEHGGGHGR